MVGGRVIEIAPAQFNTISIVRIWVISTARNSYDECIVYAERGEVMPKLGDEIWWQSGRIYFNRDQNSLKKVGYSVNPTGLK